MNPPRRVLRFDRLLVGARWRRDVEVEVDDGGRIAAIRSGRARSLGEAADRGEGRTDRGEGPRPGVAEEIAGWAVPGVPNVHSHAFQRGLAGAAEGPGTFWSWREVMYEFLSRLTPDDMGAIAAQLYVEMLKAGFTCVGEFHYLHRAPDGRAYDDPAETSRQLLAAADRAGIGFVHVPVAYQTGGFGGEALEGGQRRFRMDWDGLVRLRESLEAAFRGRSDRRLGWGIHSLRAVPEGAFAEVAASLGDRARAPVHLHVAEQEREVLECVAARGSRPVRWLLDHAPVDDRWCLVHATHADEDELGAVVRSGAVVGLCPATEANLGDGLFPLRSFAARGGRFGIGTDSHMTRSPVEELRTLEYGQRLSRKTRRVLEAGEEMKPTRDFEAARPRQGFAQLGRSGAEGAASSATAGAGGALLRRAWRSGSLALAWNGGRAEPGGRADFVVLDAEHPALAGRSGHAVLDSWVFSGTENPVEAVWVSGRQVVEGGRHFREEEIGRAFVRAMKGLARRT